MGDAEGEEDGIEDGKFDGIYVMQAAKTYSIFHVNKINLIV